MSNLRIFVLGVAGIEGAYEPLGLEVYVDIASDAPVYDLAQKIVDRGPSCTASVRAADITLWKLKPPIPTSNRRDLRNALSAFRLDMDTGKEQDGKAVSLNPGNPVSYYFDAKDLTGMGYIHLLACYPDSGDGGPELKRRRIVGEYKDVRYAFWQTLWNAYTEPVPFFVLRELVTDETLDDPDVPVPAKFWTLQIPPDMVSTLSLPLQYSLLRDDYFEAFRALFQAVGWPESTIHNPDDQSTPENPFLNQRSHTVTSVGFILTGHPGIGKTAWLQLVLVLRLHAKLPTIYQVGPRLTYLFDSSGVERIITDLNADIIEGFKDACEAEAGPDGPLPIWALIDSNLDLTGVDPLYLTYKIFVVQTPSPRANHLEWIKKQSITVPVFILQPFTLAELIAGRQLQRIRCPVALLADFFHRYGPCARLAYSKSKSRKLLNDYESGVQNLVQDLKEDQLEVLLSEVKFMNYEHTASHSILLIRPAASGSRQFPLVYPASHHIMELLVHAFEQRNADARDRLYRRFSQHHQTKTLAGCLLDGGIHQVFITGGVWALKKMVETGQGKKNKIWSAAKVENEEIRYLSISVDGFSITTNKPADASPTAIVNHTFTIPRKETLTPGYYYPSTCNQPTFDSFLYEETDKKHAVIMQATAALEHDVKYKGIKHLTNLGVEKMTYIAVTPPDVPLKLLFPHWVDSLVGDRYQLELAHLHVQQ
ncbi:hypothetical protein FPV67DRAFT_1780143 [Lyophyllum atratum]|nr:hypothetical protein FPV67DRAFT_1780143 [Lyophyllum atratum]